MDTCLRDIRLIMVTLLWSIFFWLLMVLFHSETRLMISCHWWLFSLKNLHRRTILLILISFFQNLRSRILRSRLNFLRIHDLYLVMKIHNDNLTILRVCFLLLHLALCVCRCYIKCLFGWTKHGLLLLLWFILLGRFDVEAILEHNI